jgi:hypothetical protein
MADMMGGMPPQGMQGDPIKENESFLNPTDLGLMAGERRFTPDMTVIQVLEELGIDPNGSADQLIKLAQDQAKNANPINKMQNIASSGQAASPPPVVPQAMAQGPPPSLEGLINQGA